MSQAEPPNTISHHPHLSSSIRLTPSEGSSRNAQDVFVAGQAVHGVMHITTTNHQLSLGRIELELVAREDAQTRSDALGRIFWAEKVVFQGPGLPPCAAVLPERDDRLPRGHYPARTGTASFPVNIPIPVDLPPSFSSNTASITYTLVSSIELASGRERKVLRASQPVQVVSHPSVFRQEALVNATGRGELGIVGRGRDRVLLDIYNGNRQAWGVEGETLRIHACVKNMTAFECGVEARLIRRVEVAFGSTKPKLFESVEAKGIPALGYFVAPQAEGMFDLSLTVPTGQRSIIHSRLAITVTYNVQVVVQTVSVPQHEVVASLPVDVYHPASLLASLRPDAAVPTYRSWEDVALGDRQSLSSARRWSTPAGVASTYVVALPLPLAPAEHTSKILRRPSSTLSNYSQPDWIVHLPSVAEEQETKAERTSRHLRETSGHRGRSTSPPIVEETSRLRRPSHLVGGPRPAPLRSVSHVVRASKTSPPALSALSEAPVALLTAEATTPPLLSPIPMSIEPNSYFDQQVHSLTPETPLDAGRLSHATVVSLENFAESFESASLGSDSTAGPKRPTHMASPTKERRSVMSVFDVEVRGRAARPEAKRRESSERWVAVHARHRRDTSHAAEVETFSASTARCTPVQTASPVTPSQSSASAQSHLLTTPPHPRSNSGSIRGRGGQVAAVKEMFTALEHASTSPDTVERKIRRKSVPAYPLSSPVVPPTEKRHSTATTPSAVSEPIAGLPSTARSMGSAPVPIKRHSFGISPIPPLQWNGGRPARSAFERADIKVEKRRKGAVGRLKALIDRFDRR